MKCTIFFLSSRMNPIDSFKTRKTENIIKNALQLSTNPVINEVLISVRRPNDHRVDCTPFAKD